MQCPQASKGQDFHSKQHMWLKNIPRHFREGEIKTWFDQKFPGQVDYVRVALDVHHLGRNIRERRKLITRINKTVVKLKEDVEVNEAAGTVFKESKREKRLRKIEKNKKKLQVRKDSSTSRKGGLSCSKTVPFFSAGAGEGGAGHPFDGGPGQRLGARRFSVR